MSEDELVERILAMYDMGESCHGIGRILEISRKRVSRIIKKAGIQIRPLYNPIAPHRYYNGRKYRKRSWDGYWRATTKPETYLHVDVWEFYHGPLPEDWDVHHENHDKDCNVPWNLKGMTKKAHGKHHHYTGKKNRGNHGSKI